MVNETSTIRVTGATRLVAVIGHPIAQAKSPALLSAMAAERGHDTLFVPIDARPEDLETVLTGLRAVANFAGLIVTIPHKPAIGALLDGLTEAAEASGVVNVVSIDDQGRWIGDIKDGEGLVRGMTDAGIVLAGQRVQIIGSGGAGAAAAHAFAAAGVAKVAVSDVDAEKANLLAARLDGLFAKVAIRAGEVDLADADIVVNATPVGMHGKGGMSFDAGLLRAEHVVVDMVMEPAETQLLAAARATGCRTVPGRAALDGQATALLGCLGL